MLRLDWLLSLRAWRVVAVFAVLMVGAVAETALAQVIGVIEAGAPSFREALSEMGRASTPVTPGSDISAYDLIFVNTNFGHPMQLYSTEIAAWVGAGGVLVVHDRYVQTSSLWVPGVQALSYNGVDLNRGPAASAMVDGAFGAVTESSLDNGNFSSHGYISPLPSGALVGLIDALGRAVTVEYPFGAGRVCYSTIPLDYYINSPGALSANMRVYAKNLAENMIARTVGGLAPGLVDRSFNPGTGANGPVYALARQPDGKILVGGQFTTINGVTRGGIARLNANGSLDASFNPGTGVGGIVGGSRVDALALQPDGKILVGGFFTTFNGLARSWIARLNSDGTVDTSFNAATSGAVQSFALQPDGKMLVGGGFNVPRLGIARLNADGSVDNGFNPTGLEVDTFDALALQPDGKVLLWRWTAYQR